MPDDPTGTVIDLAQRLAAKYRYSVAAATTVNLARLDRDRHLSTVNRHWHGALIPPPLWDSMPA